MTVLGIERYEGPLDQLYHGLGVEMSELTSRLGTLDPNANINTILSEAEIRSIGRAIRFNISGLPLPIGWLRQKSVIADFGLANIVQVGEKMPDCPRFTKKVQTRYGADRVLPVQEYVLSQVTEMRGRPYDSPKRSTLFFQLPRSIDTYVDFNRLLE